MVGFNIFQAPPSVTNCKVWAENWASVVFFADFCMTQWRYAAGMNGGGATGLDYSAVLASLRTLRLPREKFDRVFSDVRVLERAALEAMHKTAAKP